MGNQIVYCEIGIHSKHLIYSHVYKQKIQNKN